MSAKPYLKPYQDSANQHGTDFAVTLWANRRSQQLRFKVFTQLCRLSGKRVLDAGCSRGDFAAYLIERGIGFAHYLGIDGLCDVIDYASERGLANCRFQCGDFVTHPELLSQDNPQVVCISGSLNTMTDERVLTVLDAAWAGACEVLLFNFLSDRVDQKAPKQGYPARRLNTLELLDWAMSCTPNVVFRQDYFPAGHDATIMMRKAKT